MAKRPPAKASNSTVPRKDKGGSKSPRPPKAWKSKAQAAVRTSAPTRNQPRSKDQRDADRDRRFEIYRAIPQKDWIEMSGRQAKTINEQAARYGLPFAGATVDLPAVIKAFHDFLSLNSHRLLGIGQEAEELVLLGSGKDSPALDRYRNARASSVELDLAEKQKVLVQLQVLSDALLPALVAMRGIGDTLARQFGNEAADLFNRGIDAFEIKATELLAASRVKVSPGK